MAERNLKLIVQLQSAQAEAGVKRLGASLTSLKGIVGGLGFAFGARELLQFASSAVKASADFEQAMTNVRAVSGATSAQFQVLRQAALDAGTATRFSPTQTTEALYALSSAGLAATESVKTLRPALDFAEAAQTSVGQATEIVVGALKVFNLQASQASRVADVFTASIGASSLNADRLQVAMRNAGPVAASLGQSLEGTTAALAILTSQFNNGEMAGTGFKSAMIQIVDKQKELGISATDSSGRVLEFADILRRLEARGLTSAEVIGIVGAEAGPALATLLQQGSEALRAMEERLRSTGQSAETAGGQLDTLRGDIDKLDSAWEAMLIRLGDSENKTIRSVVQSLTDLTGSLGGIIEVAADVTPILQLARAFADLKGWMDGTAESSDLLEQRNSSMREQLEEEAGAAERLAAAARAAASKAQINADLKERLQLINKEIAALESKVSISRFQTELAQREQDAHVELQRDLENEAVMLLAMDQSMGRVAETTFDLAISSENASSAWQELLKGAERSSKALEQIEQHQERAHDVLVSMTGGPMAQWERQMENIAKEFGDVLSDDQLKRIKEATKPGEGIFSDDSVRMGNEIVDLLHAASEAADQMGEGFGSTLSQVAKVATTIVAMIGAVQTLQAAYISLSLAETAAAVAAANLQVAMGWIGVIGAAVAALAAAFGLIGGGGSGPTAAEQAMDRMSEFFASLASSEVEDVVDRFAEIKLALADSARLGHDMAKAVEAANIAIKDLRDEILGLSAEMTNQLNAAIAFNEQLAQTSAGQVGGGNLLGFGAGPEQTQETINAAVGGLNDQMIDLAALAEQLAMEFAGVSFESVALQYEAKEMRWSIKQLGLGAEETARLLALVTEAEQIRMSELETDVLQRLVNVLKQIPQLQGEAAQMQAQIDQARFQIEVRMIEMQLNAFGLMTSAFERMLQIAVEFGSEVSNFSIPRVSGVGSIGSIGGLGGGRSRSGPSRADQRASLMEEWERFIGSGAQVQSFNRDLRDLRESFFGPNGFQERFRELGMSTRDMAREFARMAAEIREQANAPIRDVLRDLQLGTGGFGGASLSQQFFAQQSEFNRLSKLAVTDLDARGPLAEVSRSYIESIQQMFGGSRRGQSLIEQVRASLEGIVGPESETDLSRERNGVLYDIRELLGGPGRPMADTAKSMRELVAESRRQTDLQRNANAALSAQLTESKRAADELAEARKERRVKTFALRASESSYTAVGGA